MPLSRPQRPRASASLRPARPQRAAEPGALQASCPARSLALVPVASPMVLPGIPDGFPETAHSVHAQRSRVEETDRIPAADEGSRAYPPTPTAPAPRAPASGPEPVSIWYFGSCVTAVTGSLSGYLGVSAVAGLRCTLKKTFSEKIRGSFSLTPEKSGVTGAPHARHGDRGGRGGVYLGINMREAH